MKNQAIRNVSFNDSDYVRSHGKAPRGRGSWAFQRQVGRELVGEIKFFMGSVVEAKKQAAEAFADYGCAGYTDVAILS